MHGCEYFVISGGVLCSMLADTTLNIILCGAVNDFEKIVLITLNDSLSLLTKTCHPSQRLCFLLGFFKHVNS